MFTHIIKYDLKTLLRSGWMAALTLLILVLLGFGAYNGNKKIAQRNTDLAAAKEELQKSDEKMLKDIALIEQGTDTGLPYWRLPTNPAVVGMRHPRVVSMEAQPLGLVATGQSDMYAHFMEPGTFGNNFALDYSEIVNPVQLLFGTFDMAFVFIFIVPLLIIAFTYNLLSQEKERGTLRVVGSQAVSIKKWLFQKLVFRFVFFVALCVIFFLLFIFLFSPPAFQHPVDILLSILLIATYALFWFVLSGIVNIRVNKSSKNALVLIGLWLLIVLIIPVTANQVGASLYPTPSRLKMINEIREANRDIEKKQDKILDAYLRDHPELAGTTDKKNYNFWHKYFASQKVLQKEIEPLLNKHQSTVKKQQQLIRYFKYLSPSIIMQESFNKIAGTSADDYDNYKQQVFAYAEVWRKHIVPLIFQEKKYNKTHYENRPIFEFKPLKKQTMLFYNIASMLLIILILVLVFSIFKHKRSLYT